MNKTEAHAQVSQSLKRLISAACKANNTELSTTDQEALDNISTVLAFGIVKGKFDEEDYLSLSKWAGYGLNQFFIEREDEENNPTP